MNWIISVLGSFTHRFDGAGSFFFATTVFENGAVPKGQVDVKKGIQAAAKVAVMTNGVKATYTPGGSGTA